MNRQIKFRMWSKTAKKFFYDPDNVYDCLRQSKHPDSAKFFTDMVWQQFTGLKSVNVAEGDLAEDIYEGDLLEFAYREDGVKFVGEVKYFEEFACFGVVIDNAFETFQDLIEYDQFFKVVGNIFEKK